MFPVKKIVLAFILTLAIRPNSAFAQSGLQEVLIKPVTSAIVIDGKMDEDSWQQAGVISGFIRNFPDDQNPATYETSAKILFDNENLYFFITMQRNPSVAYSISTLKEDFVFYENDAVGVILDPFNDYTNGYGFYVNAYGVRRDEQIAGGTTADPTIDIRWQAEVIRAPDHYDVEIMIPLKFIRHGTGTTWNINIVRNDFGANERSAWVKVPINFLLNNLAFSGKMQWDIHTISKSNRQYSFVPSMTYTTTREHGGPDDSFIKPSLDAKVSLSTALNLDVTLNPDFSQAETDQLQVNLTRFELEFPENRFFFIENSDLFSGFGDVSWGSPPNRPFYSRTIGLRYDSASASYLPKDIAGGLRVSGKITNNFRFGAMSMFTRSEKISEGLYNPSQNYSVFAIQRKIFSRSNVALMLSSRQSFGTDSTKEFALNKGDYNRVLAAEYNFASRNDAISGKVYYHTLSDHEKGNAEYATGALLRHNTKHWRNAFQVTQISRGFKPDAGFVPRTNVRNMNAHVAYSIYPKKNKINQWEFIVNPQFFLNADGSYADHFHISGLHVITRKTQDIWLVHIQERISLKAPFDPTFENENVKLDSGVVTIFDYGRFAYGSDKRKKIFWSAALDFGEYYTGQQLRGDGEFSYRLQPRGILGINYNIGRFILPEPFKPSNLFYVAPKFEYAFTKKIFFTSVIQYRSQGDNLNYYFRFQWRFGALSDFFVVYSHNRDSETNAFRSHNLVFKVVAWL